MNKIKTIYYRGFLKSCNFSCSYCPFAKNDCTQKELIRDKEALFQFYETIKKMNIETVFLIPYGEAMIHPYYHEMMANMSKLSTIRRLSIQSNLSFSVEKFLHSLEQAQADYSKINFWFSYHEEQIDIEDFLQKCHILHENGIRFCVGSVANYKNLQKLIYLKTQLPAGVYFWLNAIEGMNIQYSKEEIADFTKLDSLFPLEIKKIKANFNLCDGGKKSIFVKSNGNIYSCILSKRTLGNLYENTFEEKPCNCASCSCYLAYSCRTDIAELNLMGEYKAIRQIPPCAYSA